MRQAGEDAFQGGVRGGVAAFGQCNIDSHDRRPGVGQPFQSHGQRAAQIANAAVLHQRALVEREHGGHARGSLQRMQTREPVGDGAVKLNA